MDRDNQKNIAKYIKLYFFQEIRAHFKYKLHIVIIDRIYSWVINKRQRMCAVHAFVCEQLSLLIHNYTFLM